MMAPNSNLISVHCAQCVVEFGITRELYNRRQSDHLGFTCPNGHSNVFRKPGEKVDDDEEEEDVPEDKPEDVPAEAPPAKDGSSFKFEPIKIH